MIYPINSFQHRVSQMKFCRSDWYKKVKVNFKSLWLVDFFLFLGLSCYARLKIFHCHARFICCSAVGSLLFMGSVILTSLLSLKIKSLDWLNPRRFTVQTDPIFEPENVSGIRKSNFLSKKRETKLNSPSHLLTTVLHHFATEMITKGKCGVNFLCRKCRSSLIDVGK